jgi:fatty acid desaturase
VTATAFSEHEQLLETMTGAMVPVVEPFTGSDRLRSDGRPKPELRAELRQIANGKNLITCLVALLAPIGVVAAVAVLSTWWAVVLAVPVMATLQLRMYIIHHEAAHRLLFSNRRLNDIVGINVMGWLPLGTGNHGYRRVHTAHHRDEFGPNEPDFLLYSFYPISRSSFLRKLRRDIGGLSAWRVLKPRLVGLFASGRRIPGIRLLAMQIAVFGVFFVTGVPWLYLWLWVMPFLTWYQVINRLRSVAEHGGLTRSDDRRETTHIVTPGVLTRIFIAPLNVAYHLPHHVDSGVPFRNLPKLQQILIQDGYAPDNIIWPNYLALWRAAAGGSRQRLE